MHLEPDLAAFIMFQEVVFLIIDQGNDTTETFVLVHRKHLASLSSYPPCSFHSMVSNLAAYNFSCTSCFAVNEHLSAQQRTRVTRNRSYPILSSLLPDKQGFIYQKLAPKEVHCIKSDPQESSLRQPPLPPSTMAEKLVNGTPILQSTTTSTEVLLEAEFRDMPHAELCASGAHCVTSDELGSMAALADWLKDHLPNNSSSIEQWGVLPGTKRIANLWHELMEGEISLEDSSPPKRTVHVACVKIKDESGRFLVEANQERDDGTIRERNRPLSEKMKPGENVEDACLRGIYEELGAHLGAQERVVMLQDSYRREVQERESLSYPGLMTCYILHSMVAVIKDLPSVDFITEENEACNYNGGLAGRFTKATHEAEASTPAKTTIGVKRHFWKWVPDCS